MNNINAINNCNHAKKMTSEVKGLECPMRKMENELASCINGMKGRLGWRILLDL